MPGIGNLYAWHNLSPDRCIGIRFGSKLGYTTFREVSMHTFLTGVNIVLSLIFPLAFLWLFITDRRGRLFVCLITLFWGIGTWLWPALGKVNSGEWEAERMLIPLLLALAWALTYRALISRLKNRKRRYAAIATWSAICVMFMFSQPFAAVIMLTVVDASDLLDEMTLPAFTTIPVLVLLFWTMQFTLVGGIIKREMSVALGLALLTMTGVLLLTPKETAHIPK